MTPVTLPYRQGTPEWLEARRSLITSTDIPVLLGISPYKCEADLADEKMGAPQPEPSLRMRVGSAVQSLIGDEYQRVTGRRIKPVAGLWRHGSIEWAAASPDFRSVAEKPLRLIEAKRTTNRARFADGVPQDVEAQVQWALGVSGYSVADVAALVGDSELQIFEVIFDPGLFGDLLDIAQDFRARLAAGGPFSRDSARVKRDHPSDDGSEMAADAVLEEAVRRLIQLRATRASIEAAEETIETAVKAQMGDTARLIGSGWNITWKQTKDRTETDWKLLADGMLRQLPQADREALISLHSTVRTGFRPFRVTLTKETE